MKNSVHDNGGFIGRVADYAATDYYISTTTVSGVSSTLNYEWYNHNRGSPTTEATMDQFFDVSQSDVSLGGTGSWTTDINWSNDGTSSTTVSKPSYLPNDKFALKLSGSITAPETGTYTIKAIGDDALDIFIDGSRILYWYGGHGFGGAPASATATISLVAGQSYSFVSRMQEGGYGDGKKVEWQKPSDSALSVIPISAFSSDQTTTSNANKKNTGVWSMDADYLNAELQNAPIDIDAVYGTTYLRELTSFPSSTFSSGSNGSGQVDVTWIFDMTFSTTDTGCLLDQGGSIDGTYVGMVSGGNLRLSLSGAVSGVSNETSTTTTDMSAYAGVAGQLIVTIDYQNHIQCWWNDSTNGINQIVSVDFNGNGDWAGGNSARVGQGSGSVHGGQTLSAFTGTITRYREITTYVDTSTF